MRHPATPIFISFALASCFAITAFAAPVGRSLASDARTEIASGGSQRCWIVDTPWGPQRRCRGGGWGGYGGDHGYRERGDHGEFESRGGWGGAYGGWNGGYGAGRGD
jgi:hypothetical protein